MNTKINKDSINFKTLCYFVMFAAVILLALWFMQIIFLRVSYERYQVNNINKLSRNILKYDEEELLEKLEDIAYDNDICIEYIDDVQTVSYNSKMPSCIFSSESSIINDYKYQLLQKKNNINTLKLTNKEFEVKGLLSAIKNDDKVVFLYTNLEDVSAATKVLTNQLIYITLVTIAVSSLLALYISKRLTDPIVNITKKAKELGSNPDIHFEKSGITEIDDLSDSLNYAQAELSKVDELRRDLMANVSHDLKTPLTMIKAYAEMVRDFSYKDAQKREQHLEIIIDETDRLNTLVNDILLLSKTQAEAQDLKIEEYDLIAEVKKIIGKYEIIKETEDYEIILTSPEKIIVKADKNKINQVIYNLINNAINYTGKDKKVWVNIKENNKRILIEVVDSGKGIKKEDLKHIWDRYYKNEKNHQRDIVGTGLGLSIVKGILNLHHFNYGVNTKIGKGTTFYFEINK